MVYRRTHSVGELVGKLFTDRIVISHWWKNFVGKTVKYYSVIGKSVDDFYTDKINLFTPT
jgi:hypothetical protein